MEFLPGFGEEEFVVSIHHAVIICMKRLIGSEYAKEAGWGLRDFSDAILGTKADMIRYRKKGIRR